MPEWKGHFHFSFLRQSVTFQLGCGGWMEGWVPRPGKSIPFDVSRVSCACSSCRLAAQAAAYSPSPGKPRLLQKQLYLFKLPAAQLPFSIFPSAALLQYPTGCWVGRWGSKPERAKAWLLQLPTPDSPGVTNEKVATAAAPLPSHPSASRIRWLNRYVPILPFFLSLQNRSRGWSSAHAFRQKHFLWQ